MAISDNDTVELSSPHGFAATLARLVATFERAGLTIFARIDHQAAAAAVGLAMPPTTVLVYGNPRGGTPAMLAVPRLALDLPLRVLVREDAIGAVVVAFHAAQPMILQAGLTEELGAPLLKAQGLVETAILAGAAASRGEGTP